MATVKFKRKKANEIKNLAIDDGSFIFDVETGKTYIDYGTTRVQISCNPYPVGSIYLSINDTNPSTLFGGTWQRIAQGRTLIGVNESDTDFSTSKKTGGSKTHTQTVDEMPSHNHSASNQFMLNTSDKFTYAQGSISAAALTNFANNTNNTGGGKAMNILNPFFTCYIWQRTA